jgi:hypothetical protein
MNNLGLKLLRDAANGEGFASDPRLPQLSDDELHARAQGFATFADYSAAVKQRRDAERAEIAADAETDALLEGVRDLIGHKAIENQLRDDIAELESAASRMQRHRDAAGRTEDSIANTVRAGAAKLLASVGINIDAPECADAEVSDEQLDARLAAERRAAESAGLALVEINNRLAIKRRQLKAIESRRAPFLAAAKQQLAEPLGPLFLKQLIALKETYSLLCAYHAGWNGWDTVTFPRPRLETTNNCIPDKVFSLSVSPEHRAFWRDVEHKLAAEPAAKIKLPITQS